MRKAISTAKLIKELNRLSLRLSEIVNRDFSNFSGNQINWKESKEKWSIAECLLHLNYVSEIHLPSILKAVSVLKKQNSASTPSFKLSLLGNRTLKGIRLNNDNKIKRHIESPWKYNPKQNSSSKLDGQKIVEDFLNHQNTLIQMISDSKSINLEKLKIPVYLFGLICISTGDLLNILVYHNERHIVQAQRVHYHDDFPS
jgi:hypothetical protein